MENTNGSSIGSGFSHYVDNSSVGFLGETLNGPLPHWGMFLEFLGPQSTDARDDHKMRWQIPLPMSETRQTEAFKQYFLPRKNLLWCRTPLSIISAVVVIKMCVVVNSLLCSNSNSCVLSFIIFEKSFFLPRWWGVENKLCCDLKLEVAAITQLHWTAYHEVHRVKTSKCPRGGKNWNFYNEDRQDEKVKKKLWKLVDDVSSLFPSKLRIPSVDRRWNFKKHTQIVEHSCLINEHLVAFGRVGMVSNYKLYF